MSTQISKKEALRQLWYKGMLQWKLHKGQKRIIDVYNGSQNEITVITCARRFGKSFALVLLAVETCLSKPNAIVKYVCPTKKQVHTVVQPLMRDILIDCPPELKPKFNTNFYVYEFPNGSQIQLAGTDNGHHENLRGSRADLWVVDEAAFCDELNYVVKSILAPTTDTTGGRGIIASTPPKTPDHSFNIDFMKPAELRGDLLIATIYENPLLSPIKIQEIIDRFAGKENDPEFQREYLCKVIMNAELAVVPEFTEELQAEIIKEWPRPPFYDAYVSMDIGGRDMTGLLFAYYDFKTNTIVIEDELAVPGKEVRTDRLAKDIETTERRLYTHVQSGEFKPPYLRIADNNNPILLNDLYTQYGLSFIVTRKDDRDAALNTMRIKLAQRKIIIHPRCKTLIHHLANASWNKARKDFARSSDGAHYDLLAALMYLVRNIHEHRNPYPPGYGIGKADEIFQWQTKTLTPQQEAWANMFKPKKSIIIK